MDLDLRVEGPVALWSHRELAVLATSALVDPERMLRRITAAGPAMPDMHVVVTPHRPVACAGPGIAARLAGETTEASVTLPLAGARRPSLGLTGLRGSRGRVPAALRGEPRPPTTCRRAR